MGNLASFFMKMFTGEARKETKTGMDLIEMPKFTMISMRRTIIPMEARANDHAMKMDPAMEMLEVIHAAIGNKGDALEVVIANLPMRIIH